MVKLYNNSDPAEDYLPPISEQELSDEEVLQEITSLKKELSDQVIILGHHYQQDDIIRFADITGDSLALSIKAQDIKKPFIIFCGVHFMAETADILGHNQTVLLPDLRAGCSMADMAEVLDVKKSWDYFTSIDSDKKIIPVTYVNSSAALKAFVGERDGLVCTSSNAKKIITAAFERGDKLFFFPDQHLGRNTCYQMGIPLTDMVVYDPRRPNGGLTPERVKSAKVFLWYGFCSVHQGFDILQIKSLRATDPETKIIVHPECNFEVTQAADMNGSTQMIIETISAAPAKSKWAVGTEINLVNRLSHEFPDKSIRSLSPYQCLCTTMYRVRPRWLLECLRSIKRGTPEHIIKVPEEIKANAILALKRMLDLSK